MAKLLDNTSSLQEVLDSINSLPVQEDPTFQEKTVTPSTSSQSVTPDNGYDGLSKVTVNAMPTATQATPSITINASGLITATATQTAGYVTAGSKSATKQLAFQAAKTITPTTASQVAVSSGYYTGGSVIVNAIPSSYIMPSGTLSITENGTFDVTNYACVDVEAGGDTSIEDGMVTRTLTSYVNNRISTVGSYAFTRADKLKSIDLPACTTIYSHAFESCASLTSVNLPVCKTIGDSAFYKCVNLVSIDLPACTTVEGMTYGAFESCTSLTSVNLPVCKSLNKGVFHGCTSLTSVSLPACTTLSDGVFMNCSKLASVSLPVCTTLSGLVFSSCKSLKSISLPACTTLSGSVFAYCSSLTSVSLPACTTLSGGVFAYCSSLTSVSLPVCRYMQSNSTFRNCTGLLSIYLLGSYVCTLTHSSAFYSAGIKSTAGSIFVPASLVSSYKTATNWTYFSNRIFSYTE